MKKQPDQQDRTRLKHLAGRIEQKRRDSTRDGQGKDIAPPLKQKKSLDTPRFFQRRN